MQFTNLFLILFFVHSISLRGNVIVAEVTSGGGYHLSRRHENEHGLLENHKILKKLFVFGDSYADTGNNPKSTSDSWKEPYGITFPKEPSGRYSDGRVLADFIAKHLGIKTPVPYISIKDAGDSIRFGINFAFGGTGVFDTLSTSPNMTNQINFLENIVNKGVIFNQTDLQSSSSIVLVTCSGNDYSAYLARGGSEEGLPTFIISVVNQLAINLEQIYAIGARKIVVAMLEPIGCVPFRTIVNSYQECVASQNVAVNFHNQLLLQAITKLNNETKSSTFVTLDLYSSFSSVIENKGPNPGSSKFETPLKPCCMGISQQYSCGQINEKGEKLYTVCDDPKSSFFWDAVHPTQAGWAAVYNTLLPTINQVL